MGTKVYFHAQYQRIAARRGKNRILKEGVPFRDLGAEYYDGFHREHKIRSYLKRLQALGWSPEPPGISA